MDRSDVVYQRLHNQKLSTPEFKKPVDVVRWFGAVQAQDFNAAKWALALRMRNGTNAVIEAAFNAGQILRTHVMRPTWHFVAPDDIRWLLRLTAPRVNTRCGPNYRKYELDDAVFKQSNKVLTKALQGGKHLSRSTLKRLLNEAGVAAGDTVRLAHILLRAELDAVVCSGPRIGNQFTYALFDERVPATAALDRKEALAKLTQLYFRSHGPATLQDFMWWSGLTMADARQGIVLVDNYLKEGVVEEKVFWSPRSKQTLKHSKHSAHLLPSFDEFFVAYKDRQVVFELNSRITTGDLLGPTVIVDGELAGAWKVEHDEKTVKIVPNPARPLNQADRSAIASAVDRYAAFLGITLRAAIG